MVSGTGTDSDVVLPHCYDLFVILEVALLRIPSLTSFPALPSPFHPILTLSLTLDTPLSPLIPFLPPLLLSLPPPSLQGLPHRPSSPVSDPLLWHSFSKGDHASSVFVGMQRA